ncbi:MAG: Unknown protein [uncultured Sulfurovum sp.]|uniref:Lipoprotein n=1 Tax=uncultured Sulfurovum sp. TaxID=269237 RepID=A0A6S6TGD1_9BACT|nr:MAG: Unknown protein [uncultured Sulfurovum sp.]
MYNYYIKLREGIEMKNIKFFTYTLGLAYILSGCESSSTVVNVEKKSGYFISSFNDSIDYACANERHAMSDSGKFECNSFPISFYMDELKIGEISSIHSDGYVYPQDIIVLEEPAPVYTSEGNMNFLTVE